MRRRGSTTILLISMLASTGVLILSVVAMAGKASEHQSRREEEYHAQLAFEAAVADVLDLTASKALTLPYSSSTSTAATASSVTAAIDPSLPKSLVVKAIISVDGRQYRFERVVGDRRPATPFHFALYCQSDLSVKAALLSGTASEAGSVYIDGDLSFANSLSYIYGSVNCSGSATMNGSIATHGTYANVGDISLPNIPGPAYLAAASDVDGQSTITRNGYTFATPYDVYAAVGNLVFKGAISGRGLIYVTGKLTISGNVSYADAGSKVVFVAENDIDLQSGVSSICGAYFTRGKLDPSKVSGSLTVNGTLISKDHPSSELNKPVTIRYDPTFLDDSTVRSLRAPGYWP